MCCRNLNTDARLIFWHNRKIKSGHIDSFVKQTGSHVLRQLSIIQHHSTNSRFGRFNIESGSFHTLNKISRVFVQFILQIVGFIHHFEHLYSGSSHHWRNGVRKQIRTRTLTKQVYNFFFTGSKSTYRTTKSFTQCSGNNFNFTTKIVTFSYTTPGFAYHTCRVRFVYHHHSIVFFSQCINFVQRSYVAVHRKNAISHNQSETLCLSLFKLIFQILHICISIAVTLRFAKSHTIYNGSMV